MRAPESRLERIEQIERKLAQHPRGWTTGELAREFHVDPTTIFRDLSVLESMGTGLIKQGRRYILDHRRLLHHIKLSLNELLAIYLAVRLLSRFSDEHNPINAYIFHKRKCRFTVPSERVEIKCSWQRLGA